MSAPNPNPTPIYHHATGEMCTFAAPPPRKVACHPPQFVNTCCSGGNGGKLTMSKAYGSSTYMKQ